MYKAIYEPASKFKIEPIISENIKGPFSLAVDWITNKLYLSQKSLSRIDVFSFDGHNRSNLIVSNLISPSSIVLDPFESFLFFTDTGSLINKLQSPKIERALMDGSNRQIIVKSKMLEPIALTIDLIKKRLFWIDRKYDHLETSDYYGSKRYIIASGSNYLPHSISIDIFEKTIYYADITKMSIMKLNRHAIVLDPNITNHYKFIDTRPTFVKTFHSTKQYLNKKNPCENNNGGCDHFCLLSHSESSQSTNAFRCKCNIGFQLKRDLKTCEPIDDFLIVSQSNMIRSISFDQRLSENEARFPILLPPLSSARSIEVDCKNNQTYFYDSARKAIFQVKLINDNKKNISNSIKPIVPSGLISVENLAFDWISRNLYIINSGKITVVQVDLPKNRRNLIIQSQLYGLTVDPNNGYLFYSSVNRPAKIFRAFLDGSNITVIVDRGLSLPYTLSLDYQNKKIYWGDAHLNKIQYSDYNGNNLITLISSNLINPTSVFVFKFNLFYNDLRTKTIYKTSKYYGLSSTALSSNLNNLFQIKVYSNSLQTLLDNHPCKR
jgi:DNA-binding beta-propeller fold protein YncE